MPPLEGSSDK